MGQRYGPAQAARATTGSDLKPLDYTGHITTTARHRRERPANGGYPAGQRAAEATTAATVAEFSAATLRRDEDLFVGEIVGAILDEVGALRRMPPDDLHDWVRGDLRRVLEAVSQRRLPSAQDIDASAAVVAELARLGFTMDTVLHARRVSIRRARELLRETAVQRGVDAASQIELVHRIWEWADAIQVRDADAHREALQSINRDPNEERAWFLRALLHGTIAPNELRSRATAYGLLPGTSYMALRARPTRGTDTRVLERAIRATGGDQRLEVLTANLEGDACAVVRRKPRLAGRALAGLGPEADVAGLASSFQLATRALDTAAAFGYDGVVTLDDLSLRPAILAEDHLGERLVSRYLEPLYELGEFGTTLEASVREYLAHGMRIEESAKALFVHPNTLRHRLDRFQQLTGANLRRTEDVLELWWALQRRSVNGGARR